MTTPKCSPAIRPKTFPSRTSNRADDSLTPRALPGRFVFGMPGIVYRIVVVEQVALCFEGRLRRGTVCVLEKPVAAYVKMQRGIQVGIRSADERHGKRSLAAAIKNVNPR